ncbi:hypothetical protein P7C73_g2032, partial [Tremellales sp. Uapishka_1]
MCSARNTPPSRKAVSFKDVQGTYSNSPGNGILIAEGSAWKAQRTAGHSLTTPPTLKHFSSTTLSNHLSVLLDPLDTAAASGETIDFEVVAMDYSLAVFGELAFDADWKRMSSQFSQPFTDSSAGIARRFQLPFYELIETLTEGGVKLRHDLDRVHEFARDLVQEALVEIREKPDTDTEGFSGKGLLIKGLLEEGITDEEELSDACLNFLTAGRDTTGQAITWTLYLLLLNPSYFSLLDSDFSTEMTTSPLLENIINESLRLHPPVPIELLQNVSSSPILLPDGTVVLPSEQIMWSPYVMARLPQLWGDDAAVFRPERWDSAANKKKTAFENPVFHAGPRSCLGQPLARLEIAYAMREVLQRYEFEMGWEGRRVVGDGLTGPVLGGLPVRVKRRGI